MIKIDDHYKGIVNICTNISNSSLTIDKTSIVSQSHAFIEDYKSWYEVLKSKPEAEILKISLREYEMALLANLFGIYNLAFVGLRFFLERTLIAILFSSKEIDLRLWMRGERDSYWQEVINPETGVFSQNFCRAFFPELKEELEHFRKITEKVYRECSEYVHGNLATQLKVPDTLCFNEALLNEWHSRAATIKTIISFSFCLRYLKSLKKDNLQLIESNILDELQHIKPIRSIFDNAQ